ncbi:branched-chain amino acid ABC transporter permease [Salinisphaera orenii]|uniref:Branched-chain amino acid ABC transporter permease n=1 Tax=Salinisphaera orenii YIM 95161 TaxID=1051139 RepID=A0A423PUQ4_9GAMM|nr:branched-chain amino acid ABC transporter permease [Salinisphaera halophila]ROO29337.1 branched-chain amino acid ABC transporter permease [Salinisphaera halophila YIM 95161]
MRNWILSGRAGLLLLAVVLALAPLGFGNPYHYDIAIHVLINAIVAVGLNLLVGYAGQVSLGHAGFFGLGAYVTGILSAHYGWHTLLSIPMALVVVAVLAFAVARPILRLSGHYLAMATLGLGILITIVLRTEGWLTGGPDGMIVPPIEILGWQLFGEAYWYALMAALLVLAVWLALNLIDSPVGRALRAVHGSDVAAQVAGVNTTRYKVLIFVVSAVFAALTGALTAHYSGFITPDLGGFMRSIEFVTMVVLGGMASTFGAIVGALVLTLLPQLLTGFDELEMVVFGAVLMAVIIFMPRGLVPSLRTLIGRFLR